MVRYPVWNSSASGRHVVDVEPGEQGLAAEHAVEGNGTHPAPQQRVDQERRGPGLEPPGPEAAPVEQQQDVEGVVDFFLAEPVVAVVPVADLVPVESGQLGGEHRVQVFFRVPADGGIARVEGDVGEVVEAGEQADLGELAHPGDEGEADVGFAVLEDGVEAAQEVAVGAGRPRLFEGVENRLVVLVDQHRDGLSGPLVQGFQQEGEPLGARPVFRCQVRPAFDAVQLRHEARLDLARLLEVAAAEAQAHDRMADRPVPPGVDGQPLEKGFVPLEQLLAGVEEQALAEAPRPRQEVMLAPLREPLQVGGLVDVVPVLLPDRAEGLDADRQLACGAPSRFGHWLIVSKSGPGTSQRRATSRARARKSR